MQKECPGHVVPLYMQKPDLLTYKAIITKIDVSEINKKNYQWLQLNETIFHPKGGGQPCDDGTINGIRLRYVHKLPLDKERLDVFEILHCFEEGQLDGLKEGDEVMLVVDGSVRMLNSRMHTAGHVLAEVVQIKFPELQASHGNHVPGDAYVKFKMKQEIVIDKAEVIREIQDKLNDWTKEDVPVSIIQLDSGMRGIKVKDNVMTCGGTHVENLIDIGKIHVLDMTFNNKDKTVTIKYTLEHN